MATAPWTYQQQQLLCYRSWTVTVVEEMIWLPVFFIQSHQLNDLCFANLAVKLVQYFVVLQYFVNVTTTLCSQ